MISASILVAGVVITLTAMLLRKLTKVFFFVLVQMFWSFLAMLLLAYIFYPGELALHTNTLLEYTGARRFYDMAQFFFAQFSTQLQVVGNTQGFVSSLWDLGKRIFNL